MTQPLRIAIAGLGTVGAGVIKIIQNEGQRLAERAGRSIEIVGVSARSRNRDRGVNISAYSWVDNPLTLLDSRPEVIVELMGGSEGPAYDLVKKALERGVSVVTANKALLAHHGFELAKLAESKNSGLNYEAAVAGGIPIIKALREGLSANFIDAVYGILNGTSNYILTQMREKGQSYEEALKEAQALGYAEADPTFDVAGVDAGHKLCILASLAFGVKPHFDAVNLKGIQQITGDDIRFAQKFGYKIKLLGIARNIEGKILQAVEPCLVPVRSPLGAIEGSENAVVVESSYAGRSLYSGKGAGEGPTASAVMADIMDLAHGLSLPTFGVSAGKLKDAKAYPYGDTQGRYYLRLQVADQPGVLAEVTKIFGKKQISIAQVIQEGEETEKGVPVIITTHTAPQKQIQSACDAIAKLKISREQPNFMRIEDTL